MAFSFASAPQQQAQASPFGAAASAQSGGFGTPFGAQSQSNLFGATPQSSPFGAAQSQGRNLFGGQPSAFGQTQSNLFGAQPQSGFGFGQTQSGFGASSSAMFGAPTGFAQPTPPGGALPEALREIVERQMNPLHSDCKFQTALYNVVPREVAASYARPAGMLERTWQRAGSNNPDPGRLVPVPANWFDDLLTRTHLQDKRLNSHAQTVALVEARVEKVTRAVDADIEPRLAALRRSHRELARKLLRIAAAVECRAAQSDASGALTAAETDRRRRLTALKRDLAAPGLFKHRLCDLAELAQCTALSRARTGAAGALRDARSAAAVKMALAEQLTGMQHLHAITERAERDVEIVGDKLANMR